MKPCRIGLDIRMLQNSGIGTYLRGLLSGMETLGLSQNLVLFGPAAENIRPAYAFKAPIYSLQEQWEYSGRLRHCQLWHAPHYNVPLQKKDTRLVVTIHDIIHWVFRKQFLSPLQRAYAGFMLKHAIRLADRIIAVSHHTKKDLIEHFRAPEDKITVIHEGVDESHRELSQGELGTAFEAIRKKYGIPRDFFLYVGLIKPHKNVLRLIRIFRELREKGKVRASLVLIGKKDKRYPHGYEELASLSSTQDIFYLPTITSQELKIFYNQALALVHPSLYEGFGLTLLEAMRSGTPVLTTNASSIPEVVGDAALTVNATDESAIAEALVRLDREEVFRQSLRIKGFARVKLFSWQDMARKTWEVYEKVLSGK